MKTLKNSNGGGSVKINISEGFTEAKNGFLVMGWEVFEVHEIPGSHGSLPYCGTLSVYNIIPINMSKKKNIFL